GSAALRGGRWRGPIGDTVREDPMLIRREFQPRFRWSDVTDPTVYLNRRSFMLAAAATALAAGARVDAAPAAPRAGARLRPPRHRASPQPDPPTKLQDITS